ncbi:hypothetical protein SAMD00019534_039620 [Acytostelium subglobosum LB1]|uniref:hypothetical protein n=1 Tax=Acytostelium subglobosum LB1 TaxID=1410327 RepID=UPI000644BA5A|nr:hypothetical protein SAMD00019534_039620 [Acytostelium subglobosum LB1]GAM20787.1 hypothetical protein SAMD00019534_039620 [Acytostelium subglobosum LB1]|eukprot:XP_012755921.1 hypothetical protein SAMD00019534_039620 [Acytostelium subglobosum LB1]
MPSSDTLEKAENYLSRALRLDHTLEDAWNELGECYWKKNCLSLAMRCFSQCLERNSKNIVSLRKLSIVYRQINEDNILRKRTNIEKSVKLAKDAVSVDFKDNESWYVLGNAYLSLFFMDASDDTQLDSALKAYHCSLEQHKKQQGVSKKNPDLYYNRAIIYKYREDYQLALDGFNKALELENGNWDAPQKYIQEIQSNIKQIDDVLTKTKKTNNMKKPTVKNFINYSPIFSHSIHNDRTCMSMDTLQTGLNKGAYFIAKVKKVVSPSESVPRIAVCSDRNSQLMVISIYNITSNAIKKGDLIAVADPFVKDIHLSTGQLVSITYVGTITFQI